MHSAREVRLRRAALAALGLLSVVSLAGWAPLRRAEQVPGLLLRPLEEALGGWAPARDPREEPLLEALVSDARLAWEGWRHGVAAEGPAAGPGLARLVVAVSARDPQRRELQAVVPAGAVPEGAAATHRASLVGFVTALRPGPEPGTELAVIAPLGSSGLRAVAGEWRATPEARPVHFLLGTDGGGDPRRAALPVQARSSGVPPSPGQLCWTRDVLALGDPLPPGLLLGRVEPADGERPGGAARLRVTDELVLRPLLDPYGLDLLALAATPGAAREPRRQSARIMTTSRGDGTLRLDRGARDGLRRGDWVSQAGVFLGTLTDVGPGTAVVDATPPRGPLLCVTSAGEVRLAGLAPQDAPADWQMLRGDLLALGRPGPGGLLVGVVAQAGDDGPRLERLAPDASRAVTVWGP